MSSLLERGDEAAAAELLRIAGSADKPTAKAARRALFLLGQRGVQAPHSESAAEPPAAGKVVMANRALMTNVGGTGSRMLWFTREDPYGGSPTVMTFLVNDQTGIADLAQRKTPRREMEEHIESLKRRENTAIAEVPLDYARFVLSYAASLNQQSRNPLPQGYNEAVRFIGPAERSFTDPRVYEHLDPDQVREDQSIPRAPEKLFELPWFQGWLLDFEAVEPWETKYFEAVSSRVLVDEAQRARRGEAIVDEAAESLLDSESIARYRRRLEDSALVLHLAGNPEAARQALYHALSFEGKNSAKDIPFLRTLVHRSIYLVIAYKAELEEQADKSSNSGIIQRP